MPALGYAGIIDRLLDTLKADPSLARRVAEFRAGERPEGNFMGQSPCVYATVVPSAYRTSERVGQSAPGLDAMSVAQFQVGVVVADGADPYRAKERMFEIVDDILRVRAANPRLRDADGADPLLIRSFVVSVDEDGPGRGQLTQVSLVIIQGQIAENIGCTLTPPSRLGPPLEIPLLSVPTINAAPVKDTNYLDDGTKVKSYVGNGGTIDLEFEAAEALEAALRPMVESSDDVRVEIRVAGLPAVTRTVTLDSLQETVPYDEISRRVLSGDIMF